MISVWSGRTWQWTPGVVSVGATVTVPSSQTWVCGPVAGMTSVLVAPQTVQV